MDCQWLNSADRPGRILLLRSRTTASQHQLSECRGKSSIRVTFGRPRIREVNTVIVAQEGAGEHWLLYRVVSHYDEMHLYAAQLTTLLASFSFEQLDYRGTETHFWESINSVIQSGIGSLPVAPSISPIVSRTTFLDAFLLAKWTQGIVLLIDELSELHAASPEIRDSFLRTLRATRNDVDRYAIKSVVSAGTSSILHLNSSHPFSSPFNISDRIDNSYFTIEETRKLFNEFENDYKFSIEDVVVEDIWVKSNG